MASTIAHVYGLLCPSMSSSARFADFNKDWGSLLSATLEAWIHLLLYTRGVYPKETFGAIRFLGVKCYVNRHPGVVSYIDETVKLAVPAFLRGTADQLSLVITCSKEVEPTVAAMSTPSDKSTPSTMEALAILEEYTLRLVGFRGDGNVEQAAGEEDGLNSQLERVLRDMVLRVQSLGGSTSVCSRDDSVSFRLELQLTETTGSSPGMKKALQQGNWCTPAVQQGQQTGYVVRPLHEAETPIGILHFLQRRATNQTPVRNRSWRHALV